VNEAVLDASALLAVLTDEPGGTMVAAVLTRASISAVNLSEVVAKLAEEGMPETQIREAINGLGLDIVPFDSESAYVSGLLRLTTKRLGLSFGDRTCLALAQRLGVPAFTADRTWKKMKIGVEIRLIH